MKNLTILLISLFLGTMFAQEAIMGTEAQRAAGKVIYDAQCSQCHGYDGDAKSVGNDYLRPAPRAFTSGTFKFRTTESGELPTHEDLKASIRDGMPYTSMPAWPQFSDKELDNLAYYIKTFSEDFIDYGDVKPIDMPSAPSFSEASAERGRVVYEENQCLDCHGNLGRGDGPSAPTLVDKWDQPIRAADLTKRWTWRGGATREDIYQTFVTGLDGSPMPSYNIQPPEDQWALVDYVYSLGASDEADYATVLAATLVEGDFDISQGPAIFDNVPVAMFAVAGQVIEPGRAHYPGVNSINAQVIINETDIAIMLTWHDMTAETEGVNGPNMQVPDDDVLNEPIEALISDAVGVIFPSEPTVGAEKPYFMMGDKSNSVDLWFADLASSDCDLYVGKGTGSIVQAESDIRIASSFEDGKWTVLLQRSLASENGISFTPGTFTPIAFSVWDGWNKERGNKRGLTSWYNMYVPPLEQVSPVGPMMQYALLTLLAQLALVAYFRIKYRKKEEEVA